MKYFVFLLGIAITFAQENDECYTTRYNNIDVDAILDNSRLRNSYVQCLLDKGRCTQEGKVLKSVVPEALITDCRKCCGVQRPLVEKVLRYVYKEHRNDFDALIAKYDPDGTYIAKYQKYIDEVQ